VTRLPEESASWGLFEAEDLEGAESYLRTSPFYKARLYDRAEALEFSIEVGALR